MATIPVLYVDVDDLRAEKILLADNRTGDVATNDDEALVFMLQGLRELGELHGTGFSESELDALMSAITVPDFQPVSEDEQGRLDRRKPVTCPECGHTFTPS